jgi:hypothetical protein
LSRLAPPDDGCGRPTEISPRRDQPVELGLFGLMAMFSTSIHAGRSCCPRLFLRRRQLSLCTTSRHSSRLVYIAILKYLLYLCLLLLCPPILCPDCPGGRYRAYQKLDRNHTSDAWRNSLRTQKTASFLLCVHRGSRMPCVSLFSLALPTRRLARLGERYILWSRVFESTSDVWRQTG